MRKKILIILLTVGSLYLVYILLGVTNIFKSYKLISTANEPSIKQNSFVFASNISAFDNGDFVCYKHIHEEFGNVIWVHRLYGRSGDIVEIKRGILYVNDVNVDENLNLKHTYVLEPNEYKPLIQKKLIDKEDLMFKDADKAYVFLADKIAKQYGLLSNIRLEPKGQKNRMIMEVYKENWNTDNFGPLKIPKGEVFVIGDNRHNSQDSRYIGLINESDIIGKVVWNNVLQQ